MPPGRRHVGLVGIVVAVGALVGCSSANESESTTNTIQDENTIQDDTLASDTGFETEELDKILVEKTNAYMARCIEAVGMRPGMFDRVDSLYQDVTSAAQGHGLTFDRAQIVLAKMTAASVPAGSTTVSPLAEGDTPDQAHQQRSEICWSYVAEHVPDPYAPVGDAASAGSGVDLPLGEMLARAEADPRVLAASDAEADCLAAIGVPERTTVALAQRMSGEVDVIGRKLELGELTRAEAERQLERLAAAERKIGPAASDCFDAFDGVRTDVMSELANAYYSEHPVAVDDEENPQRELFDQLVALDVEALPLPPG